MVILHIKAGKINYSQTSGGGANRFIPNFLSPLPDQKSHLTPWADSENYLFLKKIGKKDRKFREATCQNSHIGENYQSQRKVLEKPKIAEGGRTEIPHDKTGRPGHSPHSIISPQIF